MIMMLQGEGGRPVLGSDQSFEWLNRILALLNITQRLFSLDQIDLNEGSKIRESE